MTMAMHVFDTQLLLMGSLSIEHCESQQQQRRAQVTLHTNQCIITTQTIWAWSTHLPACQTLNSLPGNQ
jgi:hypothetical protein